MYAMVSFLTTGLKLHLVTQLEENCVIRKKNCSIESTKVMMSYKWNFRNYGICPDILKEQCPRGLLAKNEQFGANCLWDVSRLYSENSIKTLLIFFFWSTPKNLERFVWSFLSITGLRSQRQFAPKSSFLASRPLGHCSFRISRQIP